MKKREKEGSLRKKRRGSGREGVNLREIWE